MTPLLLLAGIVFLDRNANGVRDPGEPGIAGVVVSNQVTAVRTDGTGRYELPGGQGFGLVFVSVPEGYRSAGPFWKRDDQASPDFPLVAAPRSRSFTFIHASDTHLDSASLPRMRMLQALVDSIRPDLVIITGDLIRDALRVSDTVATFRYGMYLAEQAKISRPVWTAPGNHEIFGIERVRSHVSADHPLYARKMYRHYLGPDYYSFNYGGIHFVALNSEDIEDQSYYGHIDSVQVEWLKRDLAFVSAATPVVTFNHIPFFTAAEMINGYDEESVAPTVISVGGRKDFRHTVSNAGQVLEILRGHRYPLALGGHIHIRETLDYALGGQPTRFEQAAAVVGPSDAAGLHFQSGITVYRVREGRIGAGQFVPLPDPPETGAAPAPSDTSHHRVGFVNVGRNVRLEVLDWGGSGPAMLFLAGLDDTGHEFDDFAPRWTTRFHVMALTRRGFGASSQPATGYEMDSLANDIRVVLDSLDIEKAILVGHSLAGDEMSRFAVAWPGRVSKLVYLDAAHDRVPLAAMFQRYPPPQPAPMTQADSASALALREYTYRSFGVRLTIGEVLSIARFGSDGRYLSDITPPTIDAAILRGLKHPEYSRITTPALAFYAVLDSVGGLFPPTAGLDSTNRERARQFYAAFKPWTEGERARFRREMANGRVVELHGAHHYLFIFNEADVLREMETFLH